MQHWNHFPSSTMCYDSLHLPYCTPGMYPHLQSCRHVLHALKPCLQLLCSLLLQGTQLGAHSSQAGLLIYKTQHSRVQHSTSCGQE